MCVCLFACINSSMHARSVCSCVFVCVYICVFMCWDSSAVSLVYTQRINIRIGSLSVSMWNFCDTSTKRDIVSSGLIHQPRSVLESFCNHALFSIKKIWCYLLFTFKICLFLAVTKKQNKKTNKTKTKTNNQVNQEPHKNRLDKSHKVVTSILFHMKYF